MVLSTLFLRFFHLFFIFFSKANAKDPKERKTDKGIRTLSFILRVDHSLR